MAKRYSVHFRDELQRLFVVDGMAPSAIGVMYDQRPTMQTVIRWAETPDDDGKTWYDHRRELRNARYRAASPEAIGLWFIDAIGKLLQSDGGDVKTADALAKLTKSMQSLLEPRFIMAMHYHTLTQLVKFLINEGLAETETLDAIRRFKDTQYAALIPPVGDPAAARLPVGSAGFYGAPDATYGAPK